MAASGAVDKEKAKALNAAITQIERQFGKGSIMRLGEDTARLTVDVIPTGSLTLDIALGVGGVPRGRVTEIYGPESSGKTTLAYHIVAQAQRLGGVAAYIDAEHAVDAKYARDVGVDIDNLLISQPDTGEQALDIAETLVRSGAIDVIVVDSVAALVPKAEIEGEMGDSHVGLQARLMSQALRKLTGAIGRSRTAVIFINQIRQKIGVMYGNPETTTGGLALKFYSSVRIEVRRTGQIKGEDNVTGIQVKASVKKNKVAPPFREAHFDILYGEGISKEGDLIELGVENGVIEKSGTWFSYKEERLGQGRENVRALLKERPELGMEIEAKLREQLMQEGLNTSKPASAVDEEVETEG
ncbi:MAG: recombinase RecA [Candidatus Latescibacteria bacterium]|nr:recombinase RecA [Candidatus Latescibacterota bacterium]